MLNIDDFIKRLESILNFYHLNASSFADKIGVQRSSLSHLLSGRNKPSLDFILKIIDVFPEVDLHWIISGKGTFPKKNDIKPPTSSIQSTIIEAKTGDLFEKRTIIEPVISPTEPIEPEKTASSTSINESSEENKIEKIVFFYKNGSFKEFNPLP